MAVHPVGEGGALVSLVNDMIKLNSGKILTASLMVKAPPNRECLEGLKAG